MGKKVIIKHQSNLITIYGRCSINTLKPLETQFVGGACVEAILIGLLILISHIFVCMLWSPPRRWWSLSSCVTEKINHGNCIFIIPNNGGRDTSMDYTRCQRELFKKLAAIWSRKSFNLKYNDNAMPMLRCLIFLWINKVTRYPLLSSVNKYCMHAFLMFRSC